jgi:tRNA(fMet)-specific endonuclease VapC
MNKRYALDTDHLTLYCRFHPSVFERVKSVGAHNLILTAVTIEEATAGWLSEIRKASQASSKQAEKLSWAYTELCQTIRLINTFQVVEYAIADQEQFISLRQQRIRIGTQDLRIAAICLVNNFTLVTRNRQDFEQVPGLQIEDWA